MGLLLPQPEQVGEQAGRGEETKHNLGCGGRRAKGHCRPPTSSHSVLVTRSMAGGARAAVPVQATCTLPSRGERGARTRQPPPPLNQCHFTSCHLPVTGSGKAAQDAGHSGGVAATTCDFPPPWPSRYVRPAEGHSCPHPCSGQVAQGMVAAVQWCWWPPRHVNRGAVWGQLLST